MDDMSDVGALSRRRVLGSGALFGLGAVMSGCATPTRETAPVAGAQPADPSALRVYGNLSTLELAPVLLAAMRYEPGKIVVMQGGILSLYAKDGDLPNLKAQGQSHLATNSETQGLRYSIENPDLRIIFTVSEGVYRIVARRSAGITKLSDLRGKRIGTMPKTSSEYYLDRMLQSVGVASKEVTIDPYVSGTSKPLAAMQTALMQGRLDAVTIWEPEMQRCKDALGADAIEFFDAGSYREQFSLYTTKANLADPVLRAKIVAFVRLLMVESERIRRDPREAWPLVAGAAKLDAASVERSWPHHTYPGTLLGNLLDVLVEEEPWVAQETGRRSRSRAELATLIDASVLEDALRSGAAR
ncbi:ABC transporter substrate-binding protein [soil metagenome]